MKQEMNIGYTAFGNFEDATQLIKEAKTIAISGHTSPDGDALGSALALKHIILKAHNDKKVQVLLADNHRIPPIYLFLPGIDEVIPSSEYMENPDLFISVDTPKPERLNHAYKVYKRAKKTLAFDHHPDMESFANIAIKHHWEAAVGCIMYDFMCSLGVEPDPTIATCILTAVVTDTGRFQYQNADKKAFEVAGAMVEAGASPSEISKQVYQSRTMAYLKLTSRVMSRIETFCEGRISFSYVTAEDYRVTGATKDESEGLIDIVRSVAGAEVCLLLREEFERNGTEIHKLKQVRGNLRSKTGADIGEVARALGGGGHSAAAGFSYKGTLDETKEVALKLLTEVVANQVVDTDSGNTVSGSTQ